MRLLLSLWLEAWFHMLMMHAKIRGGGVHHPLRHRHESLAAPPRDGLDHLRKSFHAKPLFLARQKLIDQRDLQGLPQIPRETLPSLTRVRDPSMRPGSPTRCESYKETKLKEESRIHWLTSSALF